MKATIENLISSAKKRTSLGFIEMVVSISAGQSNDISAYLSSISTAKYRTSGTTNNKTVSVIEDSFSTLMGEYSIKRYNGKGNGSKTNYSELILIPVDSNGEAIQV